MRRRADGDLERLERVLRTPQLQEVHRLLRHVPEPRDEVACVLDRLAGFQREGFSPRYLKIGGRWRDHERWAMVAEEWLAAHGRAAPAATQIL